MRQNNRSYYDEFAARYERHRHDGYHALIDRLELDLLRRYTPHGRVLEVGCGTGLLLRGIAPEAESAIGLDLSKGMIEMAKKRGLTVVQGSITALPFPDDHFDVAYSFKVLAHVERIEEALREMARVVRPGGHVLGEFYNPYSLRYLVKRLKPPTPISDRTSDEAVFTRYDSLSQIRRYLPHDLEIVDLRGVRVVTPVSYVHKLPVVGPVFEALEWQAADAPFFRNFGGFLIVVMQKRQ
jgi:ubiquinone/menaquinone biosynthesis C-methylase UbiE